MGEMAILHDGIAEVCELEVRPLGLELLEPRPQQRSSFEARVRRPRLAEVGLRKIAKPSISSLEVRRMKFAPGAVIEDRSAFL